MKITEMALRASRLTYFVALIIFVAGIATFLNFPSQEEPTVTVRDAMVTALNPGLPPNALSNSLPGRSRSACANWQRSSA